MKNSTLGKRIQESRQSMNTTTRKILNFGKQVWTKYKIWVILGSILTVSSLTAMCATYN